VEQIMTSPFSAPQFPTGIAALLIAACLAGPVAAAGSPASFDGIYTGSVAVTSVRAVPCEGTDFVPTITIADGVASLVYFSPTAGKDVVLTAPVSRGGLFAGEGKGTGEFVINVAGTVERGRITAKTWAWNCEYALTMRKNDKPAGYATASAQN
jgi:hypothetical protein